MGQGYSGSTFNAGQALSNQGLADTKAASAAYNSEMLNPGYSAAQQNAITQATTGSLAGAFGAQQSQATNRAARTGNLAGYNATEEQLGNQEGQQAAQALGGLQETFANKAISGQQNAAAGLASTGSSANATGQGTMSKVSSAPSMWGSILGSAMGGAARGCWIAAAIYGERDPRTAILRWWLNTVWARTLAGRFVMPLYGCFGRPLAAIVRRSPWLRKRLRPIFEAALVPAARDWCRLIGPLPRSV